MSILQLSPVKVGQSGVQPSSYKMLTDDSLATITAAGFLKQGSSGQFFNRNDLIEVIYNYGTPSATNIELFVSIDTSGVLTLNADVPGGLGQAAFKSVSNNALPSVVSASGPFTVGHVAIFSDTNGTVEDSSVVLGSAASKAATNPVDAKVASVTGVFTAGRLVTANDAAGTIQDSGIALKAVKSTPVAGGSAANTVTDAFCTTTSTVLVEFITQTNPTPILTVVPGAGSFVVNTTVDPGASAVMYVILN